MFTSISRFCGAEVVTTFVSICQGIRRPRGRGSNIKTRRAKTRPAAGPGRRGGRRGTRGITNGISRERSSSDGCTMYAFGLRRAAIRNGADRESRPTQKGGPDGASRTRPGGLGETARSRVPRVWRRRDPTLHIRRDRAPRAPRSPLCTVWVIRYSHSLGRPTARFHTRYDVAHGARRARARAARMLARRTAVMDAVLSADHRECAPRPILEIAWCV